MGVWSCGRVVVSTVLTFAKKSKTNDTNKIKTACKKKFLIIS